MTIRTKLTRQTQFLTRSPNLAFILLYDLPFTRYSQNPVFQPKSHILPISLEITHLTQLFILSPNLNSDFSYDFTFSRYNPFLTLQELLARQLRPETNT